MTLPGELNYDFLAPRHIVFGWGRRRELAKLALGLGRRTFVVLGSRTLAAGDVWVELRDSLQNAGIEVIVAATISHEPLVADVDQLTAALTAQHAGPGDWLLALGGGSAIDLAKAAAALATNRHSPTVKDYLEGVGRGLQLAHPPLPMVAMPTTAGTGSEATKNAVISSYDPPFKKSLRSNEMLPRIVLIDPELSVTVPPETTSWTGMDAITQLIESYVCRNARPIPQALCVDGLRRAWPALPLAVRDGHAREAREAMSQAALLSGLALANSGLGLAHGVAAALGSVARVTHGLACAVMLPVALHSQSRTCMRQPGPAGPRALASVLPERCGSGRCADRQCLPIVRRAARPVAIGSARRAVRSTGRSGRRIARKQHERESAAAFRSRVAQPVGANAVIIAAGFE